MLDLAEIIKNPLTVLNLPKLVFTSLDENSNLDALGGLPANTKGLVAWAEKEGLGFEYVVLSFTENSLIIGLEGAPYANEIVYSLTPSPYNFK